MTTWGVLRLPVGVDTDVSELAMDVTRMLDGLITVALDTPVRDVLTALPAPVSRIVELDVRAATDSGSGRVLERLLAELDAGHIAAVCARPLADALKRIDGDVVVEGLLRDGLLSPQLPAALERSAVAEVTDDVGHDALALLLAAGRAVRVVPFEGEAITVRESDA